MTSIPPSDASLSLAARANSGDREAAAELIVENLSYWMAAAHGITSRAPADAVEELVQQALVRLWERWQAGEGPTSNVRAYVTAMMRNAFLDAARSPRSREHSVEAWEELTGQPIAVVADATDVIYLHRERRAVARAFASLSADHRAVLQGVVIDGRKPANLVDELGRPASAISNLLPRAKQALHRALLVEHLAAGGAECAENATTLPPRVHAAFDMHAESDRGLTHVRDCEHCQRNWRVFASVASALGVLPLLVLTELTRGAAPASASDAAGTEGAGPDAAQPPQTSASAPAPLTVVGGAGAATPTPAAAPAALSSTTSLVAGIALVTVAVIAFVVQGVLSSQEPEVYEYRGVELQADATGAVSNPQGASFDVLLDVDDEGMLREVRVDFEVASAESWTVEAVVLKIPAGTTFTSASNAVECQADAGKIACVTTEATDLRAPFVLRLGSTVAHGSLSLSLVATAGGDDFSGTATGRW